MTGWLVFLAWLVISAIVGRALLRILLTRPVCTVHAEGWFTGKCFSSWEHERQRYGSSPRETAPLGEIVDRPLGFALLAAIAGLAWPLTALVTIVAAAKPTEPELIRRNAELNARITSMERSLRDG